MARVSNVQCHVGIRAVSHSPQLHLQAACLIDDDGSDRVDGEINEDGVGVEEDGVGVEEDGVGVEEDGVGVEEDGVGVEEDDISIGEDDINIEEDDIGIEEDNIGIEEDNIGIEEDNIGIEENGDNGMESDDYRNEDITDHNDWAKSGNHQVRRSATWVPDPGADEDLDNTAVARIDHNQQNCVQHRQQAEKRGQSYQECG
ncbi:hypothetical protein EV702DRAFT_1204395 [Suillus placidus]|uniref:Uncharacterized protein n=1 Tax=Suillus placidus TaxID=48579 RepID=A0A9P6ZI28_9AGAM|nr:hypothetical protein EV702DRAFT_1204395 [Suillus placidus]